LMRLQAGDHTQYGIQRRRGTHTLSSSLYLLPVSILDIQNIGCTVHRRTFSCNVKVSTMWRFKWMYQSCRSSSNALCLLIRHHNVSDCSLHCDK
jgi:hypothetical protein